MYSSQKVFKKKNSHKKSKQKENNLISLSINLGF